MTRRWPSVQYIALRIRGGYCCWLGRVINKMEEHSSSKLIADKCYVLFRNYPGGPSSCRQDGGMNGARLGSRSGTRGGLPAAAAGPAASLHHSSPHPHQQLSQPLLRPVTGAQPQVSSHHKQHAPLSKQSQRVEQRSVSSGSDTSTNWRHHQLAELRPTGYNNAAVLSAQTGTNGHGGKCLVYC
jgi:hypothetical protein